ncbi:MAG: hypothetical protein R3Y22_07265 [Bacteroidales bacterium]
MTNKTLNFIKYAVVAVFILLTISSCDSVISENSKLLGRWRREKSYSGFSYRTDRCFYSNGTHTCENWTSSSLVGSSSSSYTGDYKCIDGMLFLYNSEEPEDTGIYEIVELTDSTLILKGSSSGNSTYYEKVAD